MPKKETPGMMIYFDDWDMPRRILSPERFKEFFDAVFEYAQNSVIHPPFDDPTVQVFYDTFAKKVEADKARYNDLCQKRSNAGKKAHVQQNEQLPANADTCRQLPTNTNTNPIPNSNQNQFQYDYQNQYQNQRQLQFKAATTVTPPPDDDEPPF